MLVPLPVLLPHSPSHSSAHLPAPMLGARILLDLTTKGGARPINNRLTPSVSDRIEMHTLRVRLVFRHGGGRA